MMCVFFRNLTFLLAYSSILPFSRFIPFNPMLSQKNVRGWSWTLKRTSRSPPSRLCSSPTSLNGTKIAFIHLSGGISQRRSSLPTRTQTASTYSSFWMVFLWVYFSLKTSGVLPLDVSTTPSTKQQTWCSHAPQIPLRKRKALFP